MKRILSLLTALIITFSLASCGEEVKSVTTDAKISASATSVALLEKGQLKVEGAFKEASDFSEVLDIFVFESSIIALKPDGTLEVKGELNENLEDIKGWNNIVKLSGGSNFMVGLKSDGTVVASGDNSKGQAEVSSWTDIVDIATSGGHTVGLKKNGTCVATGRNDKGQCDLTEFKGIVEIGAGQMCTIGIKADGSAVSAGDNRFDLDDIKFYKNITQLSVCEDNGIILQSDGTVKFFGSMKEVANPEEWKNIIKVCASPTGYYAIDSNGEIFYHGDSAFMGNDNGSSEIIKNKVTVQ